MLVDYWELQSAPFHSPTGAGFFASASSDEAAARLQFLVENRHRLGVLIGESGCGKTVLLDKFQQDLRLHACDVCHFSLLGIDFDELLHQLATGLNLQHCTSVADAWQNIFDRISVNGYQEVATVLLLDDVHEAAGEVLTAIARLAQGSGTVNQRFTIIAAADADRSQLIGKRLLELASLRVELWPWSQAETSEFIQRELRRCGRAQGAFDVRALDRIFELTAGNPRQVSLLAELALAAGAGQSMVLVDVETVEAVIDELQITPVT